MKPAQILKKSYCGQKNSYGLVLYWQEVFRTCQWMWLELLPSVEIHHRFLQLMFAKWILHKLMAIRMLENNGTFQWWEVSISSWKFINFKGTEIIVNNAGKQDNGNMHADDGWQGTGAGPWQLDSRSVQLRSSAIIPSHLIYLGEQDKTSSSCSNILPAIPGARDPPPPSDQHSFPD